MTGSDVPETTATLLSRVRAGDTDARERLCAEYLPILMRWAHGRLPAAARDLTETTDLVQVTLIRALDAVDQFESRHEGAFLAYLRTILLNSMRNEIKRSLRSGRKVSVDALDWQLSDDSLLAKAIGPDLLWDYENALTAQKPEWREAIILRFEFGFSFDEVAAAMDRPSADAARMLVQRALAAMSERLVPRAAT
jgi:RNA polymerase sigma factor (sigma-70 family)